MKVATFVGAGERLLEAFWFDVQPATRQALHNAQQLIVDTAEAGQRKGLGACYNALVKVLNGA